MPLNKVYEDPFADGIGYHGERGGAVDPRGANPARAGQLENKSTIVATQQVGRVYDGGASDIGYEVSVNGGQSWKHGELPLTIQGGVADTCGGPLTRASDTVTAYDQRHDVWLVSTLGLAGTPTCRRCTSTAARPTSTTKDIDWGPPICQHITQPRRLAGQELDHVRQLAAKQGLRQLLRRVGQQRQRQPRARAVTRTTAA